MIDVELGKEYYTFWLLAAEAIQAYVAFYLWCNVG
jgi:hypothetical protein